MSELVGMLPSIEGTNLRVLHYFAVAHPEHIKPDGCPYANTLDDFCFLKRAYDAACYFTFVPFGLPDKCTECSIITGVSAHPAHIEIWLENSLSVSLVLGTAKKYKVSLITSLEEFSVCTVFHFIRRIAAIDKPVRILHLSDCDHSSMFQGTMGKVQALLDKFRMNKDIKIQHLMLTAKQCECLNLPNMPDSNRIEINALEANCPGLVGYIIEERLKCIETSVE